MNNKINYEKLALEIGGEKISINPSKSSSVNIFEINILNQNITEEILTQKEQELRQFLELLKEYNLDITNWAIEKLKDLSFLDDIPEWKYIVQNVLQEYANSKII